MYATLISGERSISGEMLEERVQRVAGGLKELGLHAGDVIAVLMRNDFPVLELALGAERIGVIAVPLNWHGSADEIGYILSDSNARVLFGHTDLLAALALSVPRTCQVIELAPPPEIRQAYKLQAASCALDGQRVDYENWVAASPAWTAAAVPPPFRLLYTSGTTGRPKGVKRTLARRELVERLALRAREAHGLEQRPIRAAMTGPLYHSAPNVYALNCVRFGELLVLQPKFDAAGLLDLVEKHRLSHMHAVPTMFSRLLDLPEARKTGFDPSTLVAVVHGAAMCPPDIKEAMIKWWGPVILEYYAATEIGIIAASTSRQWLAHRGTVGKAPEGVEISIVDDDDRPVPVGDRGEVLIRTDIASLVEYHQRPEAMAELRRGDWVTLGDIGYMNDEGFLWICDRKKDMVISGGVNIFPAELEDVALQLHAVRDCVAFGIPDRDLGEAIAMFVEPQEGMMLDAELVKDTLRQRLGRLRAPKVIELVGRLPREDSGKIARRKLKQQYLEGIAVAA